MITFGFQTDSVQRTKHKATRWLVAMIMMLAFAPTMAMKAPEEVASETVDAIVSKIQANRATYEANPQALHEMLNQTLIPTLHIPRMTMLILGKEHYRQATSAQKEAFATEFKKFILNTYASGLLGVTGDEKVKYNSVDQGAKDDRVVIRAELVTSSGESYPVSLYMSNKDDTRWRAYNIDVAGIDFVRTYRATFKATLDQKGIDGLIADLKVKNA